MSRVLIIGGGAAGMMASVRAAMNGHRVSVYEKNEKPGKKLFITGKGRCNLTNACDMDTLLSSVVSNSRFLYSSFYGYTNQDVIAFFEEIGVTPIEAVGQEFDPNIHNAVMHDEDDSEETNKVIEEFRKGYLYKDSVVRHSMVKVLN